MRLGALMLSLNPGSTTLCVLLRESLGVRDIWQVSIVRATVTLGHH